MKCIEYNELISAYVDEMLSPQEEEQLIMHLKTCQSCQEELESLKQLQKMCHQIEEVSLPDTFHEQLMQRLKCEKKTKLFIKWRWQYGGALVATMLVGILFWNQLDFVTSKNETATGYTTQNQVAEARVQDETSPIAYENQLDSRASLVQETDTWNIWKVQVEQPDTFIDNLKTYLEQEHIVYEMIESDIRINQLKDGQKLMQWLKDHSISFEGQEAISPQNIQLEIQ